MVLKITGTTKSCRECPFRTYYSGGQYECTKIDRIFRGENQDSIPDWCPLQTFPGSERR